MLWLLQVQKKPNENHQLSPKKVYISPLLNGSLIKSVSSFKVSLLVFSIFFYLLHILSVCEFSLFHFSVFDKVFFSVFVCFMGPNLIAIKDVAERCLVLGFGSGDSGFGSEKKIYSNKFRFRIYVMFREPINAQEWHCANYTVSTKKWLK